MSDRPDITPDMKVGELLRCAAGLEEPWLGDEGGSGTSGRPSWVDEVAVVTTRDLRPEIEAGDHPLPVVMGLIRELAPGQALLLVTPFVPAPMIDRIIGDGFLAWTLQSGPEEFQTTFARSREDAT